MKRTSTRLSLLLLFVAFVSNVFSQKVFRSVTSGNYNAYSTWEISTTGPNGGFTGATSGTTAGINYPDTSADVIIQSGHTVKLTSTQNLKNLTINAGGSLISDGTSRTLRPYHGYGLVITNNGMLGGLTTGPDAIVLEAYGSDTSSHGFTLTGTGVTQINRIRIAGGQPNINVVIDQNVTLTQSANYALTTLYNPTVVDNNVITINAGKTVTLSAGTGYFHNGANSTTAAGNYTYNINGTLDLSNSTGNVNITPLGSPSSVVTLNINGTLKLGSGGFNCDTSAGGPTSYGKVVINVNNGGTIDATLANGTFKTGVGVGQYFILSGTGRIKRSVGATATLFPVGTSSTSYTPVTLTNTGTTDSFSVSLKNTFDNAPVLPNSVVNKQWTINKLGTQTVNITAGLGWLAADEGSSFVRTNTVNLMQYTAGAWSNFGLVNPTVTGSGTVVDPYFASSNGFTTFGNFGVTNGTILPVKFANISANKVSGIVKVSWNIETEINAASYTVERSVDGVSFIAIGTVVASNAGTYNFIDASSASATNYYRIKAVDRDGSFAYSAVVTTAADITTAAVNVYPNPIINKQVSVQLSNLIKGSYNIELFNNLGQAILSKAIQFDGGTTTFSLQLPISLNAGLYRLSVSNDATRINKTISVQ
ncbi:T9SS type A sorting domain-containing protein [Parasediminibacterium paludis]|uniref:T9SS type A sorting domain-containing protein n=1 Tax=Parasediminibacterium paludis TaxID=908966 RepID=A0ABV8PTC0_9BACT